MSQVAPPAPSRPGSHPGPAIDMAAVVFEAVATIAWGKDDVVRLSLE